MEITSTTTTVLPRGLETIDNTRSRHARTPPHTHTHSTQQSCEASLLRLSYGGRALARAPSRAPSRAPAGRVPRLVRGRGTARCPSSGQTPAPDDFPTARQNDSPATRRPLLYICTLLRGRECVRACACVCRRVGQRECPAVRTLCALSLPSLLGKKIEARRKAAEKNTGENVWQREGCALVTSERE